MQNGFINIETDFILERVKKLLQQKELFDFVAFTQFINEKSSPYRKYLGWERLSSKQEQDIHPKIKPYATTNVFKKTIYSGINNEVLQFIKDNQISRVFILGIDTDCCVLKTAVDLFEHGFHPIVLGHYSASCGGYESHKAGIKVLERLIGEKNIILTEISPSVIKQYNQELT